MSEPKTRAKEVREVASGIRHWTIHDERIDYRSEAYAIDTAAGVVLIDPLPLEERALASLGRIVAIYLTGAFHQRAAWSLRETSRAPVLVPDGATALDGSPDGHYRDGERLAGGLVALERQGPRSPHFVLRRGPALFIGDLLIRADDGPFLFAGEEHHDDLAATRESVRRLIEPGVEQLLPAHGPPALAGGAALIKAALG